MDMFTVLIVVIISRLQTYVKKMTKLYILNMCSILYLYFNYTSIKLFFFFNPQRKFTAGVPFPNTANLLHQCICILALVFFSLFPLIYFKRWLKSKSIKKFLSPTHSHRICSQENKYSASLPYCLCLCLTEISLAVSVCLRSNHMHIKDIISFFGFHY